jgi:4-hydroxybenzoate polyprenyltransferase
MTARTFVVLIRPRQWLKNLMLFFPPFLSGALFHSGVAIQGIVPFAAFCCASSASYLFNDVRDRGSDARHPQKRLRPVASGAVSPSSALLLCALLAAAAGLMAWQVSSRFLVFLVLYLLVAGAYSLVLKHLAIIDIFCISLGFVLRLYGGGEAFGVYISDWLFLTVFLLSVFLSVGKRYSERRSLGESAGEHRRTLEEYPDGFLESALYLSGASVLVTYAMFAITRPLLVYTVPLCLFGLLRYLMRIKSGGEGDPTDALVRDGSLLVIGILWVVLVGLSVYR